MTDAFAFHLDRPQPSTPTPSTSARTRSKRPFDESAAAMDDSTPGSDTSMNVDSSGRDSNSSTPERSRKRPRSSENTAQTNPQSPPRLSTDTPPDSVPFVTAYTSPEPNPSSHVNPTTTHFPGDASMAPIDEDAEMDESSMSSSAGSSSFLAPAQDAEVSMQRTSFEPVDDREGETRTTVANPPLLPPVNSLLNSTAVSTGEAPTVSSVVTQANRPPTPPRRSSAANLLGSIWTSFRRPSGASTSATVGASSAGPVSEPSTAHAILTRPPNPLPAPPALFTSLAHATRFNDALDPIRRSPPPGSSLAHLDAARRSLFASDRPSGGWPPDLARSPRPAELGSGGDSDPDDFSVTPPTSPPALVAATTGTFSMPVMASPPNSPPSTSRIPPLPSASSERTVDRMLREADELAREISDDDDIEFVDIQYTSRARRQPTARFPPASYDEPPFTPSILAGPSDDEIYHSRPPPRPQSTRRTSSDYEVESDDELVPRGVRREPVRRLRSLVHRMSHRAAEDEALLRRAQGYISRSTQPVARLGQLRDAVSSMEERLRETETVIRQAEERLRQTRSTLSTLVNRHQQQASEQRWIPSGFVRYQHNVSSSGSGGTASNSHANEHRISRMPAEPDLAMAALMDDIYGRRRPRSTAAPASSTSLPSPPSPLPPTRAETIDNRFLTDFTSLTSLPQLDPPTRTSPRRPEVDLSATSPSEETVSPRPYGGTRITTGPTRVFDSVSRPLFRPRLQPQNSFGPSPLLEVAARRLAGSPQSLATPLSPPARTPGSASGTWELAATEAERAPERLNVARQDVSVVSPSAWDFASAGYDRPEVSPLTPSYPLPGAPRLIPRNLSIGELQHIRTGYTPQASRNNSIVPSPHAPPSPTPFPPSPAGGGLARSMLLGSTARTFERSIIRDGGLDTFTSSPATTTRDLPWRGWTEDVTTRTGQVSRPSITITREHITPSNSTPNPRSPELILDGEISPWSGRPSPLTSEPEPTLPAGPASSYLRAGRSLIEDYRRQVTASAAARRRRETTGWTPLSPTPEVSSTPPTSMSQAAAEMMEGVERDPVSPTLEYFSGHVSSPQAQPPPILVSQRPGPSHSNSSSNETSFQRINRIMNTHAETARQGSTGSIRSRVPTLRSWRPSSISFIDDEPPRTPTNPTSADATRQSFDAATLSSRLSRSGLPRQQSPSPTRPTATLERHRPRRHPRIELRSIEGGQAYFDAFGGRDPWDSVFDPLESAEAHRSSIRRHSSMSMGDIWRESLRHEPGADFEILNLLAGEAGTFGGLRPDQIAQLPTGQYKDSEEAKREERCPICLDDYNEDDNVMGVPDCKHYFHKDCLDQWLKTKRTCPYCRANIHIRSTGGRRRPSGGGNGGSSASFYNFGGPRGPPPSGPSSTAYGL